MTDIAHRLLAMPALATFDQKVVDVLASQARVVSVPAGQRILTEGDPADTFHIVLSGRVAIEINSPNAGPIAIETLEPGELLGVSWMLPPYRCTFDARVTDAAELIAIDAVALRAAADADPALGYALFKYVAGVVRDRLQAARVQVLDLYRGRDD
ncbi:MAG: cyclic nucleotide-binding domain-containing protein [Acidimicrobiales bacterium]|nr:cyclic nucleotide-binding domain-containing protein [Acidimicrobiales bacterium]